MRNCASCRQWEYTPLRFIKMNAEQVREIFDYDASTGELRWRVGKNAGAVAGTVTKRGYRMVMIKRKETFYVHRLIWLWVYGEWPKAIDHINTDKGDNRLVNLRLATKSGNGANAERYSNNTTGFKGVWRHGLGWAASIRKDNRTRHLGTFPTAELAYAAYCEAADLMHGEFARR